MSGKPSTKERIDQIRQLGRLTYTETILLTAYDGAIARESKLRDALIAAVADIETLRAYARSADSYRFVHGFTPSAEDAETGQRIIRNLEVARALLAEPDTTSGEGNK